MTQPSPQPPAPNPQSPIPHPPSRASRSLAVWLATGLGVGLVAPAPGTFGALWGLLAAWGVSRVPGFDWQMAIVLAVNVLGVPLCTAAGRALGGKKDHQAIVWDELASMPLVFLLVPLASWQIALAGFVFHRIWDITKTPLTRMLERLPEGWGVMADDWLAAVYAGLSLWALVWIDQQLGWHWMSGGG